MASVNTKAFGGLFFVLLVMGVILFFSAGTLNYPQAWAFLAVFGAASLIVTLYLMRNDPKLLERRVSGGPTAEKETSQKIIMTVASAGFVAILIVSGLDHRFGWSAASVPMEAVGNLVFILGWVIVFFVFRENTFTSATIELAPDQTVVSTGPYGMLRHPMYSGAIFYLFGMPLMLGSWWGLAAVFAIIPALVWRLFDEERFLANNLPGYVAYIGKVRYRLLPFIW